MVDARSNDPALHLVEPRALLDRRIGRRAFLGGSLSFLGAGLAACSGGSSSPAAQPIGPEDPLVQAVETKRTAAGAATVRSDLAARPVRIDLGGVQVDTWAYGETVPGPLLRVAAGDRLAVNVRNDLPAPTTVHWHGIALRNDMDGVPGLTQPAIAVAGSKLYEFTVPDPGTYMFHSHVGTQLDRGLYGPLIVDDPHEALRYDAEHVVVLDDWLDGTGRTPDAQLDTLRSQGMAGMSMGDRSMDARGKLASPLLGGDAGDVTYPYYLINGRVAAAANTVAYKPGTRLRLRFLNVGGDTAFRVALGGHRLTVTHTDGYPVQHVDTDALLIGMGERVDALVTLGDGAFPLVAVAEGKNGAGLEIVRTGTGAAPPATTRPGELNRQVTSALTLAAADDVFIPDRTPDRTHSLALGGDMSGYRWTINGQVYGKNGTLALRQGQRVRLVMRNSTSMFHPMHVHGHTFQLRPGNGRGARKDTVIVLPGQTVTADLIADNPGQWLVHCHNVYHGEAGMMTVLSYVR